jgi:signal transduction histidine kinase/DNA-binding NarL/FixJ family response regulator
MSLHDLHQSTILVVDDEQANIDLLVECLRGEGYERIVTTRDAREVLALYESSHPDLILLDLHMPGMDGFAVLAQLGDHVPEEEYLPILVLTADVTQATKERALSVGAKDFLTKPLDITEVLLRIRNLLHTRLLHQHQRIARRQAEDAERRASLLADASRVLTSSFDYHTTLSVLCRLIVPRIADYCVADILQADGTLVRAGISHVDAAKEALLRDVSDFQDGRIPPDHPTLAALRQGRRTLAQEITPEMIDGVVASEEHRKVIEQLQPRSLITVPLTTSGHIHGVLVLVYSESGRRYESEDLRLAVELARRAAMTIENAKLYDQAQQATRARDEMLGVVAHDLRNPLSTITMGSSLIMEAATDDVLRRHAELVRRAADRMQELITDLLEVRRIESGKLRISLRAEPVPPLVKEALAMLTPLAQARGIALEAELNEPLRAAIMDSARILQVLSNLVGNALKFTPEGGRVIIECAPLGEEVRFGVCDTGPGIPRDQIPHIFGRFWQASDRDTRGIGLGLSIVRGIVEAHQGRTWVESEVGEGARFYFTLPAGPAGGTIPLSPESVATLGLTSAGRGA